MKYVLILLSGDNAEVESDKLQGRIMAVSTESDTDQDAVAKLGAAFYDWGVKKYMAPPSKIVTPKRPKLVV